MATSSVCGQHLSLLWFPSPCSFALDPCALACALSEPLWSCSLSVFRPSVPVDLHSTAPATFSRKGFLSDSIPSWCVHVCGSVCIIEVCGSFYLRELFKLVWQERLCFADHPVSVISHLRSSAKWKDGRLWFLSPLLPLIYKWIHLVFMGARTGGLVSGMAVGWSAVYFILKVYWHWWCQQQSNANKIIMHCL